MTEMASFPVRYLAEGQRAAGVYDPHRPRSGHLPPWGEDGRGLMPSILRPQGGAFKGEL